MQKLQNPHPGLRNRSRGRSWSRPESTVLLGVGVGAGVGKIFADSDFGPESQDTSRQWTMILARRLSIVPKTPKDMNKRRVVVWRYSWSVI